MPTSLIGPSRLAVTLLSVCLTAAAPLFPALAGAPSTRAEYEACQTQDEGALRKAVISIVSEQLDKGTKSIDYAALVGDQWRNHSLDQVIDTRVDIAVEEVKSETSWTERLQSLADAETSQKLATAVAERVYRSDTVKVAIEELATGVAREVGKTVELAGSDASTPLVECLRAFVGPRYGSAVAEALAGDASATVTLKPASGEGDVSAGAVLKQSTGGLAGATILIVRRQLANLATRVGQRIVGSVLSRLVSVVAGGVGLVLIAKDLWDFRHGVLPIIASEMKAPATKDKVREEIATVLSQQMGEHIKEIATSSADQVVEIWQSFRRAHALVLQIADSHPEFRKFLDGVKPAALPRLDEVVSILSSGGDGQAAVLRSLGDGSLNEAVHTMPPQGLEIARNLRSVQKALSWSTLAGDNLGRVLDYELHRRIDPNELTKASLDRILALGDRGSIMRIAAVPAQARDALFSLSNADLNALVRALSEGELTALAGYLKDLPQGPREKILRAVAANPARMQVLASSKVRERIIASSDQSAAAEMMLEPAVGISPKMFVEDAKLVWEGRVSPLLLWDKHPQAVAGGALVLLLILSWFGRLFRPRRRPPAAPAQGA